MSDKCVICGSTEDVKYGVCGICNLMAEFEIADRSVYSHIKHGVYHLLSGCFEFARIDFSWAWQRLTKTGEYGPDGDFAEIIRNFPKVSPK